MSLMNLTSGDSLRAAAERLAESAEEWISCQHPDPDLHDSEDMDWWNLQLRVARAYLAATSWQPIASAPRDGMLFLAYAAPGQHDLPAMYALCAWHPDAGFCIDELRETTHWMALPPPPETSP